MHDYEDYQRIIGEIDSDALTTIRSLAALLGSPESETESDASWAARRLGVAKQSIAAVTHGASAASTAILGHFLGMHIDAHQGAVEIGGLEGDPPEWSPLVLGGEQLIMVPSKLIVHFPAGAVAAAALCVAVDKNAYRRQLTVYARAVDRPDAEKFVADLLADMRSERNPLRGRLLEARMCEHELLLAASASPTVGRSSLVLGAELWREIDVFKAAATTQRQVMADLGLGTSRGLLLTGPPGTGKTHLARVLAAELLGDYTVIVADASGLRDFITEIYSEAETFGPLVVILEDIDLVIGHREKSGNTGALADFLAALDGVKQHRDVFTIATTNDASAIDPAAQRTARFDTVLALPKPGPAERVEILRTYLAPLTVDLGTVVSTVAASLDGCTGSDLREVVRRTVLEHGTTFGPGELVEVAGSGRWKTVVDSGQYL